MTREGASSLNQLSWQSVRYFLHSFKALSSSTPMVKLSAGIRIISAPLESMVGEYETSATGISVDVGVDPNERENKIRGFDNSNRMTDRTINPPMTAAIFFHVKNDLLGFIVGRVDFVGSMVRARNKSG